MKTLPALLLATAVLTPLLSTTALAEDSNQHPGKIERLGAGTRFSDAVKHDQLVYLSGVIAQDRTQDIEGQTRQILDQIEQTLHKAGSSKSRILTATVWLADMKDFDGMNQVWEHWFEKGAAPARATVQAKLARSDARVEIMVVAAQ